MRIAEIGLISALFLAVLAFGGTEPLSFSVVQIVLLGLGILLLVMYGTPQVGKPTLPVAVPLVLVALVLLQIVPLPASLVELFCSASALPDDASYATLGIAPYETLSHLVLLLTYLAAFYLTLVVCQHRQRMKRLVLALLALGAFDAFYGVVQYLTGWQQIFTFIKIFNREQATGTYINPNHFAGLLEMILPFALALAYSHASSRDQHEEPSAAGFGPTKLEKAAFWTLLAILLFVALFFSRSRLGILSALASVLVLTALIASPRRRARTGAVLVGVFLLGGMLLAAWIGADPVLARFDTLEREWSVQGSGRWAIWRDTLRLVTAHPWLGTGLGTFPQAYTRVQTAYLYAFVNHGHNDYLELASNLGVPAALCLIGALLYLLFLTVRRFYAAEDRFHRSVALGCAGALAAILIHSLGDFNLYIPANALVFSTALGMTYAVVSRGATAEQPEQPYNYTAER